MNGTNHYEDDDDDEEISDEQEEEMNILEPVQGLFSTEMFPNVIEMFRSLQSDLNFVEFFDKHKINSQYDYIRLINFIRSQVKSIEFYRKPKSNKERKRNIFIQKPTIEQLKEIQPSNQAPWSDERFFQTVIDNDPALQFGNFSIR